MNASSNHVTRKSTSSKVKSESVTKLNDDIVKKRKSREPAYSEKRGLSTMYVPKSNASTLNINRNEKAVHRTSRDKEKLQDTFVPNSSKPRISSRERRKSRTLSPSEIKMLHSATRRSDERSNHEDAQADFDDADYDYEDDFEVKKRNQRYSEINTLFIYYPRYYYISTHILNY